MNTPTGFSFEILETFGEARTGILQTPHGSVDTPAFMPVGTQATVKALSPQDVKETGAAIIVVNTYHMAMRPGIEVVENLGGLHRFMAWPGPILTDSGGFQVHSLAQLRRIDDEGIVFRSHIDGSEHFFTPERVISFQERLGPDIAVVLDECAPYPGDEQHHRTAMERTHRWAKRCLAAHTWADQALFCIVQGGTFQHLRRESARFVGSLGFDGFSIGGLSLGEPKDVMNAMLEESIGPLPSGKPRHFMGVGAPEDFVEGVARGVDLFDAVLPTRVARNGALFTPAGRVNVSNAVFRLQDAPVDPACDCHTCRNFSAAYLHHLFRAQELLAYRLATIHNLRFVMRLLERVRDAIRDGTFGSFKDEFLTEYRTTEDAVRVEQKLRWEQSKGHKTFPYLEDIP